MIVQLVHVFRDALRFLFEIVLDRFRELRVGEPVGRHALHRQEAAEKLVLSLRPALEGFELAGDREIDRLVVATPAPA